MARASESVRYKCLRSGVKPSPFEHPIPSEDAASWNVAPIHGVLHRMPKRVLAKFTSIIGNDFGKHVFVIYRSSISSSHRFCSLRRCEVKKVASAGVDAMETAPPI